MVTLGFDGLYYFQESMVDFCLTCVTILSFRYIVIGAVSSQCITMHFYSNNKRRDEEQKMLAGSSTFCLKLFLFHGSGWLADTILQDQYKLTLCGELC